jgi:hypothetical protein
MDELVGDEKPSLPNDSVNEKYFSHTDQSLGKDQPSHEAAMIGKVVMSLLTLVDAHLYCHDAPDEQYQELLHFVAEQFPGYLISR